ncbi:unnamed protein product [Trichobilharzia regenti]|nr:unnamed protein product [Trichobilharzia regenti]
MAGGLAGCVAKTTIAPLDRAKINFQSTCMRFNVHSLVGFLKDTYSKHGFLCLWRGNTATLARIFPYAAIQYSAHEHYKYLLGVGLVEHSSSFSLKAFTDGAVTTKLGRSFSRLPLSPRKCIRE